MIESQSGNSPAPQVPKAKRTWMIPAIAIMIVVAILGGFSNPRGQTELERIKAQGKIIMATAAAFAPFEFYQNGSIVGFDIDLAKKIVENVSTELRTQITLDVRDTVFSNISAGLQAKEYDMCISGMTITDVRNRSVLFSTPYYMMEAGFGLMVWSSYDGISTVADLAGKKVVVYTGTTSEIWVKANYVEKGLIEEPVSLRTLDNCVQDVISGHSDVFIIDQPTAESYVTTTRGTMKVAATAPSVEPYGIAMNSGSTDLKAIVDKTINGMIESGEMATLKAKWGLA